MLLAEKLLDTLYELEARSSSLSWDKDELKDYLPGHIRYKMIASMLRQLNYNTTPGEFMFHVFKRGIPEDDELSGDVTDFLRLFGNFHRHHNIGDVGMTFLFLYTFRQRLHYALVDDLFVSGYGSVEPGMQIMTYMKERLLTEVSWIDQLLNMIVDPKKLSFDKDLLIKEYGYPTDDLEAIDLDWI